MANKPIGELMPASEVTMLDNLVLEQGGQAKRVTGQTLITQLAGLLDGHGGISDISLTSTAGRVKTYTIRMSDNTSYTFQVTDGAQGKTGTATYTHIKYSSRNPISNSDLSDVPDDWMGIYWGPKSSPPAAFSEYKWSRIKGNQGAPGNDLKIISSASEYQASGSMTSIPSGTWLSNPPQVEQGRYLWTRTTVRYNDNSSVVSYTASYQGVDGTGTGTTKSVNGALSDSSGNVDLTNKIRSKDLQSESVKEEKLETGLKDKINRKLEIQKLWENASPTSDFLPQTLNIALNGFDGVTIQYLERKGNPVSAIVLSSGMLPIICKSRLYADSNQINFRDIEISRTQIIFDRGLTVTGYGTPDDSTVNNKTIPYKIFGIKGVTE